MVNYKIKLTPPRTKLYKDIPIGSGFTLQDSKIPYIKIKGNTLFSPEGDTLTTPDALYIDENSFVVPLSVNIIFLEIGG
jgi:hypothetical protein